MVKNLIDKIDQTVDLGEEADLQLWRVVDILELQLLIYLLWIITIGYI